jgi:ElaB/YqjD/DUF883 family membrane-anchored ribosome-binding protein
MEKKKDTTDVGSVSQGTAASISDAVTKGREGIGNAASEAMDSAASDLKALRDDFDSLRETVSKFMSQASGHATKTAHEVAGQLGSAAQDFAGRGAGAASVATAEAKSLVLELEGWSRRNPMVAIATAVMVGMMMGMLGRRN